MNSKHDASGPLFHDPRAEVDQERDESARTPVDSATTPPTPQGKTSDEIHKALFSAQ